MTLKELINSESGKELRDFLLGEYNSLKNIMNVKDCKVAADQALEFKAQKKAAEKIRNILSKVIATEELEKFDKEQDNYFNYPQ